MEIPINLAERKLQDFDMYRGPKGPYYQAILSLKVSWVNNAPWAQVALHGDVLYSTSGASISSSDHATPTEGPEQVFVQHADALESRITL